MSRSIHRIEVTTLMDLLLRTADGQPGRDAIVFPDRSTTYSALVDAAYRRARSLYALGVRPGSHVGVLMANCPEFIELLFGATCLGAMCVPMNARYKAPELRYVVENADLDVLITSDLIADHADFGGMLAAAFPDLPSAEDGSALQLSQAPRLRAAVMLGSRTPPGFVGAAAFDSLANTVTEAAVDACRVSVRLGDPAIMMYTSGTTAAPKGCPLSHESLVRNGINMNRERYFLGPEDRFWAPLPMFHMSSILPLVCCVDAGAAMLSMPHIEPGAALAMLEAERATVAFPSFPTVTNDLINHPDFARRDLSALRRLNNVAPPDVLRRFQDAFPGAVQTGAYGLTEAGGVIAFNHPSEDLDTRLTTCGVPFPGLEIRIVDPDTEADLPVSTRGELWVRGYAVFGGYYKAPERTAEVLRGGWLRTGDLCSVNETGGITFHGRLKDMLKVGGENVAALEIESVLATHPAVVLAQVVGVPDDRLQEVAAAFVELRPGAGVSEAELIDFCRERLASFKVPRHVRFVGRWPMSSTKVQKFRLRDAFETGETSWDN